MQRSGDMNFIKQIIGCGCLTFVFVFGVGTILMGLEEGCSVAFLSSAGISFFLVRAVWQGLRGGSVRDCSTNGG